MNYSGHRKHVDDRGNVLYRDNTCPRGYSGDTTYSITECEEVIEIPGIKVAMQVVLTIHVIETTQMIQVSWDDMCTDLEVKQNLQAIKLCKVIKAIKVIESTQFLKSMQVTKFKQVIKLHSSKRLSWSQRLLST